MKCTQCNSTDIVKGIRVVDRGEDNSKGDMHLEVWLKPDAIFRVNAVSAKVLANVCGECGNVMFSVDQEGVSDLRNATEVTSKHGSITAHPLYMEFVKEDSYRKTLNPADLARHFAEWLRKRGAVGD